MKSTLRKTTFREIKNSFGRYFAILAIIALGVGFFVGLKSSKPSMIETGNQYIKEYNLFDYRLLSTVGFEQEDVEAFTVLDGVLQAEGGISVDFLCVAQDGAERSVKAHNISDIINKAKIVEGRMPQASDECVVDAKYFTAEDIGTTLVVSENNEQDTQDSFVHSEYKIVGTVTSPFYLNFERGTTSIGSGTIQGFIYVPAEGFDTEYFTEIFLDMGTEAGIYSEEYKDFIEEKEATVEALTTQRVEERYASIMADANEEVANAKIELSDKEAEAQEELDKAKQDIEDGKQEIQDGIIAIQDGKDEIAKNRSQLKKQEKELNSSRQLLQDGLDQIQQQKEMLQAAPMDEAMLQGQLLAIEAKEAEMNQQIAQVEQGFTQIVEGYGKLNTAQTEIEDNEKELSKAQRDLADGEIEYTEALAEFETEITDAKSKIADAEEEIAEIEEADSYVLNRDTNIGYVSFENDSDIVEGVSKVFPIFFFLVAALVCITTMNRMVEEQRTQIGVLKALGYSEFSIMGKYTVYSGSAALIGCVAGYVIGMTVFPFTIWEAYSIMYGFAPIEQVFQIDLVIISVIGTLLCSVGTTYLSCRYELKSVAAELIRPKAPSNGKRIFLERITFLWKHLKFLHKVSIRNIVRYKKRFFMMVLGISGCTALLLTGYGIKDSVANVVTKQYDEIQLFDVNTTFTNVSTEAEREEFKTQIGADLASYEYVMEKAHDLEFEGKVKPLTLVIPENADTIHQAVDLHTSKQKTIPYPNEGEIVITEKIADNYKIEVGDSVKITDSDRQSMELTVSGISINYFSNYAYIARESYTKYMGKEPQFKNIYANLNTNTDAHGVAAKIMKLDNVAAVSVNADMETRFSSMMQSLDYVIALILVSAGSLAFIVLYNLTNINITERIREIATIKVLGFYPLESAAYVFRENMVLTAVGAIVGLGLGYVLHGYVMKNIEIDMVAFDAHIGIMSYVLSIAFTFLFAFIVNVVMYFKLDKINMAESLKSIE